jgi:hypothetical protein
MINFIFYCLNFLKTYFFNSQKIVKNKLKILKTFKKSVEIQIWVNVALQK